MINVWDTNKCMEGHIFIYPYVALDFHYLYTLINLPKYFIPRDGSL
jgi:hypothetical protein